MTLEELARLLGCETARAGRAPVAAFTEDSRRVVPGAVFVAAQGEHADGHAFAAQAVQGGAVAIMGSRPGLTELEGVPYLSVAHPRRALGTAAHALLGDPSRSMTVIGITGTNGKSSSVTMLTRVLESAGHPTACFGTLGYDVAGESITATHTTPFGEELAAMFGRARDAGLTHVVMEVSSHSLEQERVAGIDFDVAAFTNLTQDHLDYHKDMDAYRRSKLMLFERIEGPGRFTVVNADDPSAQAFAAASRVPCHTFGAGADCQAHGIRLERRRTCFKAETPWGAADIEMRLLGEHNVSNTLCVIAVCGGLGLPLAAIAGGIASLQSVPGRFEHVDEGQDFQVIVDYAHTEDGLRNVLRASRAICRNRVIAVFGCGGDRDKSKRPKMARATAELADYAIITSDNPRTEDPERILADVEQGMVEAGKRRDADYEMIQDRRQAIGRAIELAQPDDLVMIAGKGHEDYQILGTERIEFDDRVVAREWLQKR
jgi:UDP-N-acetylmuramoyl-L-alanyl-D-glutamate--2,6-diaminopimelate ligase